MIEDLRDVAELVAGRLDGTGDHLTFVLEELIDDGVIKEAPYEDLVGFTSALDSIVFCCSFCGWWMDVGDTGNDVDGQWACVECGGEID